MWPINAESISEATGSAVKAKAAGNAIRAISSPSSSILKTSLRSLKKIQMGIRSPFTDGYEESFAAINTTVNQQTIR
uniref:MATE efflux family protein 1 n=1 Tax=Rhizophora mucronata TaxID=61149 RepID=A0A2P2M471_RHIMU